MSAYAYANAVTLAFMSCVIHLATIAVLRDYLRDRKFLKHLRVAIMVSVAILLLQAFAESWTIDDAVTLRCAIANYSFFPHSTHSPGPRLSILGNIAFVTGFVMMLFVLLSGYFRRIRELYTYRPHAFFPPSWQIAAVEKTIGWPASTEAELNDARRRLAQKLSGPTLNMSRLSRICFLVIPRNFSRSFMYEIVWLAFYFTFGVSQVTSYLRESQSISLANPVSFEPTFGQLLPLVLTALPFLAMAEGYSGK